MVGTLTERQIPSLAFPTEVTQIKQSDSTIRQTGVGSEFSEPIT